MTSAIFARPRHDYASYADLYRLIEVSGYPLIYLDEIDPHSDNTYIMTILNGENMHGWQRPRARIILYDLEWHLEGVSVPGVAEVWAADRWYAKQIGAQYVPLGSDARLRLDAPLGHGVYDVATLWYVTYRRSMVLAAMRNIGLRLAPVSDVHGIERHQALSYSKVMAHVHQHDGVQTIAPQRFALAAAYKLPVVSETLSDAGILQNIVQTYDFHALAASIQMLLPYAAELGEQLHGLLCIDHSFGKTIEANL